MPARTAPLRAVVLAAATGLLACSAGDEAPKTGTDGGWRQHDIHRPRPPVAEPAAGIAPSSPPKDAVVLFDGSGLDAWRGGDGGPAGWAVKDGVMEVVPGAGPIHTDSTFGDVQMHVEWASPDPPIGIGQDRGNCGIFLMGRYELQVLDSYRADTYADGQAGAIYGQYPPLFNASRPPGEWQSYDIAFRRPRFGPDGKLITPARVTLFHNGVLVQDNEELLGQTNWLRWSRYEAHGDKGPVSLQDHGHRVRFRNMWARNLPERPSPTAQDLKRPEVVGLSTEALDTFAGTYAMGSKPGGTKVAVSREEGHLLVKFPFLPHALAIEPTGPSSFAMPHTDGRFSFTRDATGRVTGGQFQIGDGERTLRKLEP